jgi:microcystin-dependent protein
MGECPSQGWEPFHEGDGKFIVGAGSDGRLDPKSNGASTGVSRSLASYFVSDQGGEESRVLSEEYIPRHTHSISAVFDTEILNGFGGSEATYGLSPKFNKNAPTKPGWSQSIFEDFMSAFGGDKDGKTLPLSNLPPYIALNWCRRTG